MSTSGQAEDHAVPTKNLWIAVVICQVDDDDNDDPRAKGRIPCAKDIIPRAKDDAKLIADVLQHVGICAAIPELLFVTTKREVLDGLKAATERMRERGALRLLVCYFGRAYRRHLDGSTWMHLKDLPLSLECSVSKALREADLEKATQVIIADCLQDMDPCAAGDCDDEWRGSLWCLYSAQKTRPTGDTGHFAAALAYCLLCRPPSVSELFREVRDLVSELTFFRQRCEFVDPSSSGRMNIRLFSNSYVTPLAAISERDFEDFLNLFQNELFFLARWLCELSGHDLCRLKLEPSIRMKGTEGVIGLLKDIFDQLKEKAKLFSGNLWFRQLNLVHDCKDLHEVLEWLRKRPVSPENRDAPQQKLCRPSYITPDIQQCLLESLVGGVKDEFDDGFAPMLEEGVKDGFDDEFEDLDDGPAYPSVEVAADLWKHLSEYFYVSGDKLFDTEESSRMTHTYAIYAEGVKVIKNAKDGCLQEIGKEINKLSKVFGIDTDKYKLFLHPSLWIIIRSDTRLQQLKEFMGGLAKWYEQRCGGEACWKGAKAPRRVPLSTAPRKLLDLAVQVENCSDFGSCMWLHAEAVRKHSLERLNERREHGDVLDEWQVAVFDGDIEARGRSWLQGHGDVRLVALRRHWVDLDLPSDLRSGLMELALRRQWQQDFTFHAAAFVMHIEQKGFEQNKFSTQAWSANRWSAFGTPQDFLRAVFTEVLALKSSAREGLEGVAAQGSLSSEDSWEVISPTLRTGRPEIHFLQELEDQVGVQPQSLCAATSSTTTNFRVESSTAANPTLAWK